MDLQNGITKLCLELILAINVNFHASAINSCFNKQDIYNKIHSNSQYI